MKKLNSNSKFRVETIGILSIIIVFIVAFIETQKGIPMIGDTKFHMWRVYEIREAFRMHQLPLWLNFSSFHSTGQAINGMYPDITLWPLVLITNNLRFIDQLVAMKLLIMISTFFVTYISLANHNLKKEDSFYAAILYTFSGYSLYQYLYEFQPGAIIIYIFTFPLIFAIDEALYAKRLDKFLIVKLSLLFGIIMYSHLLTAVVVAFIVILLWILKSFFEQEINYLSILILIYSGLLTLVYSLPILYRIYIISRSSIAPPFGKGNVGSENLIDIFNNPQVYSRTSLSCIALTLFIISLYFWNKNIKVKKLLIAELVIIVLCTNLIPWVILEKLPLINMFQYTPWRFGIYLSALPVLAFLYVEIKNKYKILYILSLLTLVAIPETLKQDNQMFQTYKPQFLTYRNIKNDRPTYKFDLLVRDYLPFQAVGTSTENKVSKVIKKQVNGEKITTIKGDGERISSKLHKVVLSNTGINFYNKSRISGEGYILPVYYYPSLKYEIYIQNKAVNNFHQSSNGFLQLVTNHTLEKNTKITIKYKNPKLYIILIIFSLTIYVIISIYFFVNTRFIKFNTVRK
nr:hypothetical protein [Limosilactobacillus reuteri]